MQVRLIKDFQFEAAHRLPMVDPDHKCFRLHGHSFKIEVEVTGPIDETRGWLVDYSDIGRAFQPLMDQLDHNYLNEVEGLENPTSELLARWIYERLNASLPGLSRITVHETCNSRCIYEGG